jgi:hypothetical protein
LDEDLDTATAIGCIDQEASASLAAGGQRSQGMVPAARLLGIEL